MTIADILTIYDRWNDQIIRVYNVKDYGRENEAKTIYPMCYGWELPSKMVLGDYQNMMRTEVLSFKSNLGVALHFYVEEV